MMGPTDNHLEQYLWGEELSPQEQNWCEERVARDPELQRNFHQVHRLLRRFKTLREWMRKTEEAERHIWFTHSLNADVIPLELRTSVNSVMDELFMNASPTSMIKREVARRIGDLNELPEAVHLPKTGRLDKAPAASLSVSQSATSFSLEDFSLSEPSVPRKPDRAELERMEIRLTYPKLVRFMRRHHGEIYDRWEDGSTRVRVLGRLHAKKGQPALMAGLELLDLTAGLSQQ